MVTVKKNINLTIWWIPPSCCDWWQAYKCRLGMGLCLKGSKEKREKSWICSKARRQTEYESDGGRDVFKRQTKDRIRVGVGRRMRDGSSDGLTQPPICEPSLSIVSSLGGGREESPDALHTVVMIILLSTHMLQFVISTSPKLLKPPIPCRSSDD